jgi:hypothetical protein
MAVNKGKTNELDIINMINLRSLEKMPKGLQNMLVLLFQSGMNDKFKAFKINNEQKADIAIDLGSVRKYVSIKSGQDNSVHSESVVSLIQFLRTLGITQQTLKTILFFHYGDGTLDGSGLSRFTSAEIRKTHHRFLKAASRELSQPKHLRALIERFIVKGVDPTNVAIDGIYYGDTERGFFITTKDIYRIIIAKRHKVNGSINMGVLTYQPGSRNLWGIVGSEQKRQYAEIKWRHLDYDIIDAIATKNRKNGR